MTVQNGSGNGDGAGNGDGNGSNSAGAGDSSNQNQNQNQNGSGQGNGGNQNQSANNQNQDGNGGSSFDPEKDLTKEQWQAIYGSGRFKQLNERAQRAAELEKAAKDAEEAKLKEQGEWQKLAQSKDEELTALQGAVVNAEIRAEAARLGAVNPTIVANALDLSGVEVDQKTGNITGVKEAIEALKESDPYLFNSSSNNNNQTKRVGSPTNPGGNNTGYKFTMSQIKDQKFYQEHRKEIGEALRMGQVDKDN